MWIDSLYYLLAVPINSIFRDRDLQLTEENGNARPAPASPTGPLGTYINAQDQPDTEMSFPSPAKPSPVVTGSAGPWSPQGGRRRHRALWLLSASLLSACLESVLAIHGITGCIPEG